MLIELTMALPCTQRRPASITLHLDESIMIGTREMSGSLAIRFRKRTMAAWLSSMASSMLMSMICAPFSTCWRATAPVMELEFVLLFMARPVFADGSGTDRIM